MKPMQFVSIFFVLTAVLFAVNSKTSSSYVIWALALVMALVATFVEKK